MFSSSTLYNWLLAKLDGEVGVPQFGALKVAVKLEFIVY